MATNKKVIVGPGGITIDRQGPRAIDGLLKPNKDADQKLAIARYYGKQIINGDHSSIRNPQNPPAILPIIEPGKLKKKKIL